MTSSLSFKPLGIAIRTPLSVPVTTEIRQPCRSALPRPTLCRVPLYPSKRTTESKKVGALIEKNGDVAVHALGDFARRIARSISTCIKRLVASSELAIRETLASKGGPGRASISTTARSPTLQ